jgi:hypothetical protein
MVAGSRGFEAEIVRGSGMKFLIWENKPWFAWIARINLREKLFFYREVKKALEAGMMPRDSH